MHLFVVYFADLVLQGLKVGLQQKELVPELGAIRAGILPTTQQLVYVNNLKNIKIMPEMTVKLGELRCTPNLFLGAFCGTTAAPFS